MAEVQPAVAPQALSAAMAHVDHRRPIHDQFCRCMDCKPPLRVQVVRSQDDAPQPVSRVTVALAGFLVAFALFVAARLVRAGVGA